MPKIHQRIANKASHNDSVSMILASPSSSSSSFSSLGDELTQDVFQDLIDLDILNQVLLETEKTSSKEDIEALVNDLKELHACEDLEELEEKRVLYLQFHQELGQRSSHNPATILRQFTIERIKFVERLIIRDYKSSHRHSSSFSSVSPPPIVLSPAPPILSSNQDEKKEIKRAAEQSHSFSAISQSSYQSGSISEEAVPAGKHQMSAISEEPTQSTPQVTWQDQSFTIPDAPPAPTSIPTDVPISPSLDLSKIRFHPRKRSESKEGFSLSAEVLTKVKLKPSSFRPHSHSKHTHRFKTRSKQANKGTLRSCISILQQRMVLRRAQVGTLSGTLSNDDWENEDPK